MILVLIMMLLQLSPAPLNATQLKCVSMTNQECKVRPKIVNANINENVLYLFSIKTSKFSGSCDNINYPYAKMCVRYVVEKVKC